MRARDETGAALVALLLAVVIGIGAAAGLSVGLVSVQSNVKPVTQPLVTYNTP